MELTEKSRGYIDQMNYQSGRGAMDNETEGFHLVIETEKFGKVKYQITKEQAKQINAGKIRNAEIEIQIKLS